MHLTREQAIEVQNWYCAGVAGTSNGGTKYADGTWAQVIILRNTNIVTICGKGNDFTGVFLSDGKTCAPMTLADYNVLSPLYKPKNWEERYRRILVKNPV